MKDKKIYVALYKGNDKLLDKIITWTSRGFYSHIELIVGDYSYGSSGRDGGIRKKEVALMNFDDKTKWDLFELLVDDYDDFVQKINIANYYLYEGIPLNKNNRSIFKYDFLSVYLYHVLRLSFLPKIQEKNYICSEFVLELISLGLMNKLKENVHSVKMKDFAFGYGWKLSPTNVLEVLASCRLIKIIDEEEVTDVK